MIPNILLRVDASVAIGSGHVARCLTLADALAARGAAPAFLCNAEAPIAAPALAASSFPRATVVPDADLDGARALLPEGADLVVFDHYGIAAEEERRFRSFAPTLAAIDDLGDRPHDVDVLIDPMPNAVRERYAELAPSGCDVRCGPEWLMLRPEFRRLRPKAIARRSGPVRRLFVCIGGTDPRRLTPSILSMVERSGVAATVDVVLGSAAPTLEDVERIVSRSALTMRLHVNASDVAEMMTEADLAIGGGGTMTWERCALGLPTIALIVADNQCETASFFADSGAGVAIDARRGLDSAALLDAYVSLAIDEPRRAAMANVAASVCDGLGADRTADLLIGCVRDRLVKRGGAGVWAQRP